MVTMLLIKKRDIKSLKMVELTVALLLIAGFMIQTPFLINQSPTNTVSNSPQPNIVQVKPTNNNPIKTNPTKISSTKTNPIKTNSIKVNDTKTNEPGHAKHNDTDDSPHLKVDKNAFISIWNTSLMKNSQFPGNKIIVLPLVPWGSYNFLVQWGDGLNNTITSWNQFQVTHIYSSPGTYTVNITGTIKGWDFGSLLDFPALITRISQWGSLQFNSSQAFLQATNLVITANDTPNLSTTYSMASAFGYCTSLGNSGNFNSWNVSTITSMQGMFVDSNFNGNISSWDVSHVTNMNGMFYKDPFFNQAIGDWNVSSVTDMSKMFLTIIPGSFNQPLNKWDVSHVTDMNAMFVGQSHFNQPLDTWDVSSVTNMYDMFYEASAFNQPLDSWNVSHVTNMDSMFFDAKSFNQPLGLWDISHVTDLFAIFLYDTLSVQNYNNLLLGWSKLSLNKGLTFDAGYSTYSYTAANARQILISTFNWIITDGGEVPTAPQLLQAKLGHDSVLLSWSAPFSIGGSNLIGYYLYQSTTNGTSYSLLTKTNTTTFSYNDTQLLPGQTIYVVTADNSQGQSVYSNEVIITRPSIPDPPTNLQATPGNRFVSLTWLAPGSNGSSPITAYHIYRSTSNDSNFISLANLTASTFSYTDHCLTNGQIYDYVVTASNKEGESAYSNKVYVTPATVPHKPSHLRAHANDTFVVLTWTAPRFNGGSAITGYNIYRYSEKNDQFVLIGTVNSSTFFYNDTNLTHGHVFFYLVKAKNNMGLSHRSNIAVAKLKDHHDDDHHDHHDHYKHNHRQENSVKTKTS